MNNPALYHEDNLNPILLPVTNTGRVSFRISCYTNPSNYITIFNGQRVTISNLLMDYTAGLSGSISTVASPTIFTGNVKIYPTLGRSNVYSLVLGDTQSSFNSNRYNIQDLGQFLEQFPRLYSFRIGSYHYGVEDRKPTIKADFATIPKYVKKIYIENCDIVAQTTNIKYDLSVALPDSELEYFRWQTTYLNITLNIYGDLANLPPNMYYFRVQNVLSSTTQIYTPGRVWRADFDTFYFNKVLSATIVDNILIDMSNSITSAVGGKIIYLRGTRTSASDSAVTYLQSLGFTVTITA